jgi:hypothetical protein
VSLLTIVGVLALLVVAVLVLTNEAARVGGSRASLPSVVVIVFLVALAIWALRQLPAVRL